MSREVPKSINSKHTDLRSNHMPNHQRSSVLLALLSMGLALAVTGCGGGGSEVSSADGNANSSSQPSPVDTTNASSRTTSLAGLATTTDSSLTGANQNEISPSATSPIDLQESPNVTTSGIAGIIRNADTAPVQTITETVNGPGWVAPLLSKAVQPINSYTAVFKGRAWYIDPSLGNDASAGTLAAPWKSLSPTAKMKFADGDALLLKCGEVLRGTLELTSTQASVGNILIAGYGDCSADRRPIIRASDVVTTTGWTKVPSTGQEIYVKPYTNAAARLFLNGKPLTKARFPNYQRVGAEFATAVEAATNQTTSFKVSTTDLAALAGKDVIGASIYVRATQWQSIKATVQSFDASTGLLSLDRAMPAAIKTGTGFILEGKRWMLDSAGEWFYDEAAKQLYLWAPAGVSPATLSGLEASWRQYGLNAKWINKIRVERLMFEQQQINGMLLTETKLASISDVKVRHSQEIGIEALTSPGIVIQDSTVESAGNYGIVVREAEQSQVLRNQVTDTGGNGRAAETDAAIAVFGNGALVESNLVERSAGFGIRFANRPATVVRGNTVMSFCLRFTDCAGIYTYTGGAVTALPGKYIPGALVESNMVVGAKSNTEGCGYNCKNMAIGVYLDELSSGVTVSGNTISNTEIGLALMNGNFNRFTSNTVRGSAFAGFTALQNTTGPGVMRGNQLTNNSFFVHRGMTMGVTGLPVDADPINAQSWQHPTDAASLFSGLDPNVVAGNEYISVMKAGQVTWSLATPAGRQIIKEAGWKAYAPTDRQTNYVTYKNYSLTTDASLIANGSFASNLPATWSAYLNPTAKGGSFTLANFASCGKTCGRLVAGSTSDYLVSNAFTITNTVNQNLYVLNYAAIGGAGGGQSKAYVRRAVSPWENFGLNLPAQALAPGETVKVEAFFRSNANSDAAVLDLRSPVGGETYYTDVSLARVQNISFPDLPGLVLHLLNPSNQALAFPCSALGLTQCVLTDNSGAQLTFPLTVAARSSRTVFVRDPKWLQ